MFFLSLHSWKGLWDLKKKMFCRRDRKVLTGISSTVTQHWHNGPLHCLSNIRVHFLTFMTFPKEVAPSILSVSNTSTVCKPAALAHSPSYNPSKRKSSKSCYLALQGTKWLPYPELIAHQTQMDDGWISIRLGGGGVKRVINHLFQARESRTNNQRI